MKKTIKIIFLAAEISPLVKVGGLGDVIGALPKAIKKLGADIILFLPFYGAIDAKKYQTKYITSFLLAWGNKKKRVTLWRTKLPGSDISIYLIKQKYFQGKLIYSPRDNEKKAADKNYYKKITNIKRFALFTKASLEALKKINFKPDIINAHDWHTALTANFIKMEGKKDAFFSKTKTVYTIHNLSGQGIANPKIVNLSKINPKLLTLKVDLKNGDINFMVQGILNSDAITTVSPTYAREILTHYQGVGLDNILKKRKNDLIGILNGIDTEFFNPKIDRYIAKNYSLKNLGAKLKNKLALQKKLGLPQDKNIALAGLISRLVWQKGIELFTEKFSQLNCQFVFLGAGDKKYEVLLKKLAKKYPRQFKVILGFDESLAHQIYAGADIFLMPSRFEPCGLGQMISMRYGTVPVVRQTGGLADTVQNYTPFIKGGIGGFKSTGFIFKKFDSASLYNTLKQALNIYYNQPKIWRRLQINGMKKDFSWDKSAREYLKLYKKVINK